MGLSDIIAIFKLIDPRRKPLERAGAFLCRRKIAALEADFADLKRRLVEVERERDELHRKEVEQSQELAALRIEADRRNAYRHVLVDGVNGVFALRRGHGEEPRLVCPKCFERGLVSDLCFSTRTVNRYTQFAYDIVNVRCADAGCEFGFAAAPETIRQAFKFVD